MTGRWPKADIDHINHKRTDNRWSNLREVSRQDNLQNRRPGRLCHFGIMGIIRSPNGKKFRAQIGDGKTRQYLGTYEDFFEACCVRKAAENRMGYHPNHSIY